MKEGIQIKPKNALSILNERKKTILPLVFAGLIVFIFISTLFVYAALLNMTDDLKEEVANLKEARAMLAAENEALERKQEETIREILNREITRIYSEQELTLDQEYIETFNWLIEQNPTTYNIRNKLLLYNTEINFRRASYKAAHIYLNARKYSIDPYLLTAIGIVESNLKQDTVSSAGARGIFQLMPIIERRNQVNALIFEENTRGAAAFIHDLFRKYDNTIELVLAHYNAGSNPQKALEEYPETQNYVKQVTEKYERFKKLYATDSGM